MLKLAEHVIYDVDEETKNKYLMDIESGVIYNINGTAAILVEFIQDQKSVEEYIAHMMDITNNTIQQEQIESDTNRYISNLVEKGMLCEV